MSRTSARYSTALRITGPGAAAAFAALVAGAAKPIAVREISAVLVAATSSAFGLVRAATVGTATTSKAGVPHKAGDAASDGSVKTAWSAAPTVAATPLYFRRLVLPATIGASITWSFRDANPLILEPSTALLLWNFGADTASDVDMQITWEEGL